MATNAVSGLGTYFRYWDGTNWVDISEIINITGPTLSRNTIEVVTLNSANAFKNFLSGFRDSGTITFTMVFRRDTYAIIMGHYESDDNENYEIYFGQDPEETSFEFEGLVTEMPLTVPAEDKITVDVTIKIDGQITLNSGSGSA